MEQALLCTLRMVPLLLTALTNHIPYSLNWQRSVHNQSSKTKYLCASSLRRKQYCIRFTAQQAKELKRGTVQLRNSKGRHPWKWNTKLTASQHAHLSCCAVATYCFFEGSSCWRICRKLTWRLNQGHNVHQIRNRSKEGSPFLVPWRLDCQSCPRLPVLKTAS